MSASGNVARVSSGAGVTKSGAHKAYSPTEKKSEYLTATRVVDEILESADKPKDEERHQDNAIATKTSVVIDEKNELNTDLYLRLMNSSKQVFKHTERHSIGKKFVSDKLI